MGCAQTPVSEPAGPPAVLVGGLLWLPLSTPASDPAPAVPRPGLFPWLPGVRRGRAAGERTPVAGRTSEAVSVEAGAGLDADQGEPGSAQPADRATSEREGRPGTPGRPSPVSPLRSPGGKPGHAAGGTGRARPVRRPR
ncbi:hypothetical protein CH313_09175 [Streptomyces sp. TSRI0384-2]|nr:hypothetical protein CH313_09175 [Streptomyces sp. TSRI0384-2]